MGFFDRTKSAGKFVFFSMPARVFGIGQIRSNQETISALYQSLRNPVCPECSGGVLRLQDAGGAANESPDVQHVWSCNRCQFQVLGPRDAKALAPTLSALRQQRSLEQFDGLSQDERERYASRHTLHSRIFFGAAIAMVVGFVVMALGSSTVLLSLNWLALAGCMFIFGLKNSYRAWQVENGVLYVPGAFKSWFNNERWIR